MRGDLQRRQRIEEARGQPAQAAVAQPGLLLLLQQLVEVQAQLGDRLLHLRVDAEVDQVVAQVRADQELGRQVGDRARALLGVGRGRADPALQQAVAHHVGERQVVVALGGQGRELALHVEQVVQEGALERLLAEAGALVLGSDLGGRSRDRHVHGGGSNRCKGQPAALRKKHAERACTRLAQAARGRNLRITLTNGGGRRAFPPPGPPPLQDRPAPSTNTAMPVRTPLVRPRLVLLCDIPGAVSPTVARRSVAPSPRSR